MSEQPEAIPLGYGVSGWKARQQRARMKNSRGRTPQEKEAIRAARRKLYEQQQPEPKEPEAPEPDNDDETFGPAEEVELTREEMIAELKEAGQTVHPSTKDDTLVKKVEALRNGEA